MLNNLQTRATYIDTAVNYNNDYLLAKCESLKIISKIAACHYEYYDFFVDNHLKCLNRNQIDIMLIHSDRGKWQNLAKRMQYDKRFLEIGVSNFDVNSLLKYKQIIGNFPAYNELEVNVYYVDKETINFCKANGIKIIAYGILGGKYNAARNVAEFSLPYLIQFASAYSDIIILRADSIKQTDDFLDVINNYKETPLTEFELQTKKSIQPMQYKSPSVLKRFSGELTYHIACGKNVNTNIMSKQEVKLDLPEFEMLGDYLTYVRYMFRQIYDGSDVYDYDFLIGDDNSYYMVYLFDKDDKLTKVNVESKKILYRFERK